MPHQTPPHHPSAVSDSSEALNSSPDASTRILVRAADAFAFSSGLATSIGALLSGIASRLLGAPDAVSWAFLAASGTFIIYSLDRLRDTDRDRTTSPLRTAFVLRNWRRLYVAVGVVGIGFVAALLTAPAPIITLSLVIGLVGLFHRRLKEAAVLKVAYVSFAWVATCVGIPWVASGYRDAGLWIASILLASLAANLIASNLRDDEGEAATAHNDTNRILWIARAMALLSIGFTLAAPTPLHALIWIPVCEGLALACFQPTERYGQFAIDGGLLIGALATSIHLGWTIGWVG